MTLGTSPSHSGLSFPFLHQRLLPPTSWEQVVDEKTDLATLGEVTHDHGAEPCLMKHRAKALFSCRPPQGCWGTWTLMICYPPVPVGTWVILRPQHLAAGHLESLIHSLPLLRLLPSPLGSPQATWTLLHTRRQPSLAFSAKPLLPSAGPGKALPANAECASATWGRCTQPVLCRAVLPQPSQG